MTGLGESAGAARGSERATGLLARLEQVSETGRDLKTVTA